MRVALALRWALFEEGRDISRTEVLLDVAAGAGLDSLPADDQRVLDELAEGRSRGVIGSPHIFAGGADFFCPALRITHGDAGLRIVDQPAAFDAMLAAAFGDQPVGG
jgi:2-hydroxychromene-2-carboxylate isomerase